MSVSFAPPVSIRFGTCLAARACVGMDPLAREVTDLTSDNPNRTTRTAPLHVDDIASLHRVEILDRRDGDFLPVLKHAPHRGEIAALADRKSTGLPLFEQRSRLGMALDPR